MKEKKYKDGELIFVKHRVVDELTLIVKVVLNELSIVLFTSIFKCLFIKAQY